MATPTPQSTLSFPRDTFAKLSPHPYLLAHLQPASSDTLPSRANGRTPSQFRTPHINNGSLTHAEGSAVVRIGDTTVVCGVRSEILLASRVPGYRIDTSTPTSPSKRKQNEAKDLDLLVPNIELATGCSPAYLPGVAPTTLAQSLSTRIYSLLHSSSIIDPEDLRIWYQPPNFSNPDLNPSPEDEEVETVEPEVKAFWTLYIDILFISLDGNPFDAAWAAVLSALKDVRLPKAHWDPDREMILCSDEVKESRKLKLRGFPVAVSASVFRKKDLGGKKGKEGKGFWLLVDPDTFEEGLCDEGVSVVIDCEGTGTKILGISKKGGTSVGPKEMRELVGLAEGRWKEFKSMLKG